MKNNNMWCQASPWLFSALISSLIPFAFLLLLFTFPAIRKYHIFKEEPLFPNLFCLNRSLSGIYLTIVLFTSFSFWVPGISRAMSSFSLSSGWRPLTSYVLMHLAIGGTLFMAPLLSTLWSLAIDSSNVPLGTWGVYEGNHGPWRYVCNLRILLHYIILLPLPLLIIGLLSFVFKPTKMAIIVIMSNIIIFFAIIWSHFWLID